MLPLLRELSDLKRIRSAGRGGSIAQRLFAEAWQALVGGAPAAAVMGSVVFNALAAARLGDLDRAVLAAAGLPEAAIRDIRRDAVLAVTHALAPNVQVGLPADAGSLPLSAVEPPAFVALLAAQPRAGATSPGRGRIMFEPAENHAEHCAVVAITGVLLAPAWGADPTTVFLAGLAHHLHNATLPDAGFAGEALLGAWLEPAFAAARRAALAELPPALQSLVERACAILPDAETAEGCAFHAADTLDRVLQIEHHLRAARTTMAFIQRDMALVHEGPVKPFQDALLARMELAA